MDSDLRDALAVLEKKLEAIEEKIDILADDVEEIKEMLPTTLDEDLSEIKSTLMQMEQ
ncbi:hypothetical protein DSCA_15820 [Desulfosarcina alkanivorans]|uniref:Uncharacterized protein n=1 Tax=Desulfosarcina alkanivorans TaxID=571177 RepID=A0A5K7YDS5_9BACT|nr:hypothetical protein [Desulfosarcina alkanivorans]BBO67652.1 hypothetical protein DSCA_15820 [Desulfosarcina alkanivorans]